MTNTSKTIIFFGTDDFSLVTLRGLVEANYHIAAVVTKPDSKSGRGQTLNAPAVKKYAQSHNIEVWQPSQVTEINDKIQALGSDVIGVLVSFGKIIPKSTIDLFNPGIINIHPSLLPIYRGPSPIESAIKNGDKQTGVSIMQLTPKMDAGPIYGQVIHPLLGNETGPELYKTLAGAGSAALLALLPHIVEGSIIPTQQDDTQATYCSLITKEDAWLKPNEITAGEAERQVRAYLDFPKTKYVISDHQVIVTKAHISTEQKTPLDIKCQNDEFLSIDELIAPSGRTMSAKDFLNGYKLD